jgi:uncharacterized membrane protein YoaK (UPF0700 family)
MNNYVLDFGSFAFENWWQVGFAASAFILFVLLNVIPFVCLVVKSISSNDDCFDECMLACASLIPFIGMIAGIIFWDKNKTVNAAVFVLMFAALACLVGSALCLY